MYSGAEVFHELAHELVPHYVGASCRVGAERGECGMCRWWWGAVRHVIFVLNVDVTKLNTQVTKLN